MNNKIYAECLYENNTGGTGEKTYELYEFEIDENEPDPDARVTYINDTVHMIPAYMDYDKDEFNYGSWKDAFFMKVKPCMLRYGGTVDYYLNENDYDLKRDGSPSDIANENYEGNGMVEFPKIYYKIVENGDNISTISICNKKLDSEFKCYSNIDSKNNVINHFYMPIYDGSLINNKLRSISGKTPLANKTRQNEVDYAKANNSTDDIIWYTGVVCDWLLVGLLLTLISKSTDSQTKFGTGNCSSYTNNSNTGVKQSGTLNKKGLFYGNQDKSTCVKVFGMENFWGNIWKCVAGWVNDRGTHKVKMTYGTYDDSTVEGYNLDGNGYISIPNAVPSSSASRYISSVKFTTYGLIPYVASGTATTYYCDGFWCNNTQNNYALVGGGSNYQLWCGAFCSNLSYAQSMVTWDVGASLSCKPLAKE